MDATCEHHWHPVGAYIDHERHERVSVQTCCHCGERQEQRTPLYGSGSVSWQYTREGCGPHVHDPKPHFADR